MTSPNRREELLSEKLRFIYVRKIGLNRCIHPLNGTSIQIHGTHENEKGSELNLIAHLSYAQLLQLRDEIQRDIDRMAKRLGWMLQKKNNETVANASQAYSVESDEVF